MIMAAALTCGCSSNEQLRRTAIRILDQGNKEELIKDATELYNRNQSSSGLVDIPQSEWPRSFLPFKPVRVWSYSTGIYIVMEKFVSHTAGVYIIISPGYIPANSSVSSHEFLYEGIYWTLS